MNEELYDVDSLTEQLMSAQTPAELDKVVALFNLNIQKKNIVRSDKLSEVQDKITDQISQRLTQRADEFSNADLLSYFKTIQDCLIKAPEQSATAKIPQILINQNNSVNLNVSQDGLNRESRERVSATVRAILAKCASGEVIDTQAPNVIDSGENNIGGIE